MRVRAPAKPFPILQRFRPPWNDRAAIPIFPNSSRKAARKPTYSGEPRRSARFLIPQPRAPFSVVRSIQSRDSRSEEHTSELQSPDHLVCRLLLEKKNVGK